MVQRIYHMKYSEPSDVHQQHMKNSASDTKTRVFAATLVPDDEEQRDKYAPQTAVADSGANIHVTNRSIVANYNLQPKLWEKSFKISFGNNSSYQCTYYAGFGPILGRVAIVDDAPETLISVAVLTQRGFQVNFLPDGEGVGVYYNGQIIFHGVYNETTNLFHLDIGSILHPKEPMKTLMSSNKETVSNVAFSVSHKKEMKIDTIKEVLWLHKRMGHPSRATMIQSIQNGTWSGLDSSITPQAIQAVMSRMHCTACGMCKMHKRQVTQGEGLHGSYPGEEISVDYQGKITPTSVRGFSGFYLFKGKYSGYRHGILVKDKSAKTYLDAVESVIQFYNCHGFLVHKLRCDAGSTENDQSVVAILGAKYSVKVDAAAVEHQNQNFVEREAQTLIRGVGCLLVDQQALGSKWWCYAVQSWIQTANTRPHSNSLIEGSSSCDEIVTGVVPDVCQRFRFPFGCPVTSIRTGVKDQKYDSTAEFGIAIGTTNGENGSTKVLIPGKGIKPVERYDVQVLLIPPLRNKAISNQGEANIPCIQETKDDGIHFSSSISERDDKDTMTAGSERGTLGFSVFDIENHAKKDAASKAQITHLPIIEKMTTRMRGLRMEEVAVSAKVLFAKSATRTANNPTLKQAR